MSYNEDDMIFLSPSKWVLTSESAQENTQFWKVALSWHHTVHSYSPSKVLKDHLTATSTMSAWSMRWSPAAVGKTGPPPLDLYSVSTSWILCLLAIVFIYLWLNYTFIYIFTYIPNCFFWCSIYLPLTRTNNITNNIACFKPYIVYSREVKKLHCCLSSNTCTLRICSPGLTCKMKMQVMPTDI